MNFIDSWILDQILKGSAEKKKKKNRLGRKTYTLSFSEQVNLIRIIAVLEMYISVILKTDYLHHLQKLL